VKTHAQQQSVFTCGNLGNLWFLRGYKSIMQNKPNFKMGNINISPATTKPYLNEQRTMNNERCSKQTQSNPIPARWESPAIRNTQYEIRTLHNRRRAAII
jgi:hypothetical protein